MPTIFPKLVILYLMRTFSKYFDQLLAIDVKEILTKTPNK